MDKARELTDKKLDKIQREVGRVYKTYPALLAIEKEYSEYMTMVQSETEDSYSAYIHAIGDEEKKALKKAYTDEVKALTINSQEYHDIVKKFTRAMAEANQKALDVINKEMRMVYVENYNQVAEDCRKAGIEVNGEE